MPKALHRLPGSVRWSVPGKRSVTGIAWWLFCVRVRFYWAAVVPLYIANQLYLEQESAAIRLLCEINKEPNYSIGPLMKINLLIGILLVALYSCNFSGESEKERQLFDKIKTGMTKEEVIRLLGKPDTITYSIVDSSESEFLYFSKNKSVLRSTMPTVSFDSTNRVTFATYGE
jgi:hypothetical protein